MVLPKRHARRSVTRSLLKRQIRAAIGRSEESLSAGLWVVRLRSPFDRATFTSAASSALGEQAGEELTKLLQRAA
jgi:ribonuclease P protein component